MKQGTGWYAFASPAQCGPREPRQMSPEIQEIEWIVCDWVGEGRGGQGGLDEAGRGIFWVEEQRARERGMREEELRRSCVYVMNPSFLCCQ